MADQPMTVLIAEDDVLLRDLLTDILASQEGIHVIASVAHGREVLDMVSEMRPRVTVLDLEGPHGLRLVETLAGMPDSPLVLVLSGDESEEMQLEVARHGADGFLCKSQGVKALVQAIRAIAAGEVWFTRQIVGRLLREHAMLLREVRERQRPSNLLSAKEREVLARVARGLTNQQIADELTTSVSTVKVHIRNIFQKLELPNRTEAAVYALREGLLELPEMSLSDNGVLAR